MFKRVICLLFVFLISFSIMVYGKVDEEGLEFYGNELYSSSLEDLAGRRLYVYGIVDSLLDDKIKLDVDIELSRLEAVDLFYRLCLLTVDKSNEVDFDMQNNCYFSDVPLEYQKAVNYLVSIGIVTGVSEIEFGVSVCDLNTFCCILLRYLNETIEFKDSVKRVKEYGLLKYVTVENGFTKGDAYLILSNLLDLNYNGQVIKDGLVFENKRDEIRIPNEITIYATSYLDFLDKLEVAYFFAPRKIYIEFVNELDISELDLIYNFLIKEEYAWEGLFDEFYNINTVYSYGAPGWIITYSEVIEGHWRISKDIRAVKALELYNGIDSLYHNGFFSNYGELSESYSEYMQEWILFKLLFDKQKINISLDTFNDWVYLNIDTLDWIKCYNDSELTKAVLKCLSDMDAYKNLTDYEKAYKVHDYICRKSSYDNAEYRDMMTDKYSGKYSNAHEVEGFVIDGKIVCDGYAYTYQWLLDYLDVECVVIYGDSTLKGKREGHAWNKVRLDNKWYNVDVCWADTGEGMRYFLKSDNFYEKHYHLMDDDYKIRSLQALENYK